MYMYREMNVTLRVYRGVFMCVFVCVCMYTRWCVSASHIIDCTAHSNCTYIYVYTYIHIYVYM